MRLDLSKVVQTHQIHIMCVLNTVERDMEQTVIYLRQRFDTKSVIKISYQLFIEKQSYSGLPSWIHVHYHGRGVGGQWLGTYTSLWLKCWRAVAGYLYIIMAEVLEGGGWVPIHHNG